MKAYEIGEQQGLTSLRAVQRAEPVVTAGQALVQVRAVCLNHRDLKIVGGAYGALKPHDRVPVSDGVGHIVAFSSTDGSGTAGLKLGDRVVAPHFCSWIDGAFAPAAFGADLGVTLDGWLAERIVVPASALVRLPDALSDVHAASLSAAGLTAWNALVEVGRVKAGQLVLVLGTGGVSIFALQLAKMHGARVAITSSSDEKLAFARTLGADILVNYRSHPDWAAAVLAANAGHGADTVVETGGLATLAGSINASAPNGRIVLIGALGALSGAGGELPNFSSIIGKNLLLRGITGGSRTMLQDLVTAANTNRLEPVIGAQFGFDDAAQAYAALAAGTHVGKVLIRVADAG
jgi:NADPH:quinone reductase-like Zn-dependent oxidoreductase